MGFWSTLFGYLTNTESEKGAVKRPVGAPTSCLAPEEKRTPCTNCQRGCVRWEGR